MRFANGVNELVVRFNRLDQNEVLHADMLVMERIYPIDFRTYEVEMREIWCDLFTDQLAELHKAGFVHHDLKRPAGLPGLPYDNILLTANGLRLIDVGISVLKHQVGQRFFDAYVQRELAELAEFKDYFVTR